MHECSKCYMEARTLVLVIVKVVHVHNNCETIAFMFNGGSYSGFVFCLIDTRICIVLLHY